MNRDQIERTLRRPGPRERGYAPVALPATLADARARSPRTLFVVARTAAFAGAVAAGALFVLFLTQPSPRPGGENAPVGAQTAQPSARPSASPAMGICAPADLAATAEPWGGAAGSRGTVVTVTNTGSRVCGLQGHPGATITDANGTTLVTAKPGIKAADPLLDLVPGGRAVTSIQWGNWCAAEPAMPLGVTLQLQTGTLAVPAAPTETPPCNGPGQPTSLSTTAFARP